jgi:DNA-binding CsgD family transcriptional regulator
MKPKYPARELEKLDEAYNLIATDVEQAIIRADELMKRHKSRTLTYLYARSQMVFFIANVSLKHHLRKEIDPYVLKKYFQHEGFKDDAALLMLWMIRYELTDNRPKEARALDVEYDKLYAHHAPVSNLVLSLFAKATFELLEKNKAAQLELALQAETIIRGMEVHDGWYWANLSTALQIKVDALSQAGSEEMAETVAAESIAIAESAGVSPHITSLAFLYAASIKGNQQKFKDSLDHYKTVVQRLSVSPMYEHMLVTSLLNMAFLYSQLHVGACHETKKQEYLNEQLKCLDRVAGMPAQILTPKQLAYVRIAQARVMRMMGRHPEGITLLAKALRILSRHGIAVHLPDAYIEAFINYYQQGLKQNSMAFMRRSYLAGQRSLNAMFTYNQAEGREKMEALANRYELKQKELNEKLLQQKVEAMNKEIQMANISLHEKVVVLDTLKEYVASLKKKGQESSQLIRQISQQIDKVILTEQEKATLQKKMDDANDAFYKVLAEKYPQLTNLEIHICGLLKTGMTDKELSKVYGLSDKSYEQHRYRIKKKIKLGPKENLVKFLKTVEVG